MHAVPVSRLQTQHFYMMSEFLSDSILDSSENFQKALLDDFTLRVVCSLSSREAASK